LRPRIACDGSLETATTAATGTYDSMKECHCHDDLIVFGSVAETTDLIDNIFIDGGRCGP